MLDFSVRYVGASFVIKAEVNFGAGADVGDGPFLGGVFSLVVFVTCLLDGVLNDACLFSSLLLLDL